MSLSVETSTSPTHMPLLPLRDVVVFPHMVIPLFVGRPKSIKALEAAMEAGKSIVLVAQKSAAKDDPAPEDLGTSQIEGFTVQGTRSTHIMNAGVIGNDKPIATTTERWFSTEFKVDLVNISENPEAGKHVRKLVNIRAGEPDPLLFQVPPDFTVKEIPQQ